MEHLAIMKKSWGLLEKILQGEKKIESRWYKTRRLPWGKIKAGDIIYFKNTSEPVSVRAEVEKIEQHEGLEAERVKEILEKYGKDDGIPKKQLGRYYQLFKDKKYCILIFLKKAQRVFPFNVSKKGFGMMASWITVEKIKDLSVKPVSFKFRFRRKELYDCLK